MAYRYEEPVAFNRNRRSLFVERYPDYPLWLDGQVWAIDIETEITDSVPNFRAALYYNAKALGFRVQSKIKTVDGRQVYLVQAFPLD